MPTKQYHFPWGILRAIIAGASAVDLEGLAFGDRRQADGFLAAYGYDPDVPSSRAEIEIIKAKAMAFLREELLQDEPEIEIPEEVARQEVGDLLVRVSDPEGGEMSAWACAMLRIMHAFAHARNDPWEKHREEIRSQILQRIERHMDRDGDRLRLGRLEDSVPLSDFLVKESKSPHRIVMKLLHKPGNLGESVYDHMGVRFVTRDLMDAMMVVRYLRVHNVVVFANVAPERSRNTLLDIDAYQGLLSRILRVEGPIDETELRAMVNGTRLRLPGGTNSRSSSRYRAIHFTVRHLVKLPMGDSSMRLFFPYEVQVMDEEAARESSLGEAAHENYVKRQRTGVKRRVLRGLYRRGRSASARATSRR